MTFALGLILGFILGTAITWLMAEVMIANIYPSRSQSQSNSELELRE